MHLKIFYILTSQSVCFFKNARIFPFREWPSASKSLGNRRPLFASFTLSLFSLLTDMQGWGRSLVKDVLLPTLCVFYLQCSYVCRQWVTLWTNKMPKELRERGREIDWHLFVTFVTRHLVKSCLQDVQSRLYSHLYVRKPKTTLNVKHKTVKFWPARSSDNHLSIFNWPMISVAKPTE